ncbi:DinB family protein [Chitinophaga nivalis]|uniref:DinB family protein n=1 Tax=Chitinophaga nivalis TaxID=2991709 RepID=A0ABT3IQZ8_9BACT|nr:DinB family protein [Chitinophaga nivalis]MCW3464166.1 DinB family protein [Chitinophaga nivalis]MCW3486144.1 DinB family protein [Chitinophaga nivalis]
MSATISNVIEDTSAALLQALARFDEEQFNTVPFAGSWTAGQVADHLQKSVFPGVLYGPVSVADRDPEEKNAILAKIFLDFDLKMTAPDFVQPSAAPHEQAALLNSLEQAWQQVGEAATTLDLQLLCTDSALPQIGTLTRSEWIHFMLYHTQRHTRQLQNIYQQVNGAAA